MGNRERFKKLAEKRRTKNEAKKEPLPNVGGGASQAQTDIIVSNLPHIDFDAIDDIDIATMNAEAPLLDLIRQDDCGKEYDSGDYIKFETCPICEHHDCFVYVRNGNYWQCFSENHNQKSAIKAGGYSDYLRAKGVSNSEAIATLREVTGHPRQTFTTITTTATGDVFEGFEKLPRNEKTYSRLFARWLSGKVCFVPEEKGWRYWDGKHWVKDGDGQRINRLCKKFVDDLIVRAQRVKNVSDEERKSLINHVNNYNRLNDRKRLIEDTKCELTVYRAKFDADTHIINLQNGTFNLDTLTFAEGHDPNDLCGKVANVNFDPNATCEEWERFLNQSLDGDKKTIELLQVVLGLALTADTSAECMFILLGKTRSGKSTTVETIQRMLNADDDGYSCSCNPETFAIKKFDDASRPSSDVARLAGKRFVVTSEPPKNMLFNVARLKQLTGRDMITARYLHENEFQFYPQFTLIMTANNAPRVNDMTLFDSDRIHVIPFNNHLEASQRDLGLKDRLAAPESLSGILNWCIDGLRRFRRDGLIPSPTVLAATAAYRTDSDKIQSFMNECTVPYYDECITAVDLYRSYQEWCKESGYQAEGRKGFYRDLRERGLLAETHTINGRTVRHVVLGCKLGDGYADGCNF